MKRIYEVTFDEKRLGCKWVENSLKVLANGDLRHAIAKARKHTLAQKFQDDAQDGGKLQRCVGFKAKAVTVIAEADI